tara:strand:- start:618 stop:1025 length:408 start_codon:yes stop_codon:yes gene_type:complete
MEASNVGTCLCGEVKFEVMGDFENFFLCHCKYCQKDTGSAHAANLFSSRAKLIWRAGEKMVKTFNLPGTKHIKSFCIGCGTALPSLQSHGKLLVVPAGSLDGELTIEPNAHLFVASKAGWDEGLEKLPKFDRFPN